MSLTANLHNHVSLSHLSQNPPMTFYLHQINTIALIMEYKASHNF